METVKKVDPLLRSVLFRWGGDMAYAFARRFDTLLAERDHFERALVAIAEGGHRTNLRAIAKEALAGMPDAEEPKKAASDMAAASRKKPAPATKTATNGGVA